MTAIKMSEFSAVFLTEIEELDNKSERDCPSFTEELQKAMSYLRSQ
jgi:hypothetical protein